MIARKLGMRVSTQYDVGDEVLVRFLGMRPGRRRKQKYHRLLSCLPGRFTQSDQIAIATKSSLPLAKVAKVAGFH